MLKADTFIEKAAAKENSRATVVFAVTTYKKSKKKKKSSRASDCQNPNMGFHLFHVSWHITDCAKFQLRTPKL